MHFPILDSNMALQQAQCIVRDKHQQENTLAPEADGEKIEEAQNVELHRA